MINRENYIANIGKWIGKEKIIVLKGARQVGKTTIMKYFYDKLKKENKKVVFIFADDIDNTFLETPNHLMKYLELKYGYSKQGEKYYIFIDEFQYLNNAGLYLKNIFDKYKNNLQLIVSGSSSLEITKNTEFLTGRTITYYIDRLSFKEVFNYNQNIKQQNLNLEKFDELKIFYDIFKQKLESEFLNYLNYGGYPEAVKEKNNIDKEKLISEIVKVYIEKDVSSFLKIENITAFNNLIKILASNIGDLVNINNLSSSLNISMQTVNKYIDILEGTFIFSRINPFYTNVKKELSKMPKIFIEDISISNYKLGEFNSVYNKIDIGNIVENFIYTELRKKISKDKLYFYRTVSKSEIDFVVEESYGLYSLIEVKYRNKVKEPLAFRNFEKTYKVDKKIIITKDMFKKEDNIYYIPACIYSFL